MSAPELARRSAPTARCCGGSRRRGLIATRELAGAPPRPATPAVGGRGRPRALPEQAAAVEAIVAALDGERGAPRELLLHGVTGSGKTEVYLAAVEAALARGKGAIVLVPEIGLAPQAVARFRARLGDRVAVLHSALPPASATTSGGACAAARRASASAPARPSSRRARPRPDRHRRGARPLLRSARDRLRRKDDQARADADPRLAGAQAPPLVVAGARRHPGMKQCHLIAELTPEPIHRLRSERDLGDEHNRATAAGQRFARGLQIDLRLPRAGNAVEKEGACRRLLARTGERRDDGLQRSPLVSGQLDASRTAPTAGELWRRRRSTSRVETSPRASSLLRVARSDPALAASCRAALGPAASARSTARCRSPSRSPREIASSPFSVASTSSSTRGRTRRASAPVPTPGGRTRPRPRAVVEQYSSPTQRPSATSSGGTPASSASNGSARRSCGRSLRLGEPNHDPDHAPPPERHDQHRTDRDLAHRLGQAVVEGPGDAPGGQQRLDLGDRHPEPRLGALADGRGRHVGSLRGPAVGGKGDLPGTPVLARDLGFYLKGILVAAVARLCSPRLINDGSRTGSPVAFVIDRGHRHPGRLRQARRDRLHDHRPPPQHQARHRRSQRSRRPA